MVVELDAGAVSEWCDLPTTSVRDFGDEVSDMETFETAAEGGLGAPARGRFAVIAVKYPAEVGVAKAAELMFSVQDGVEEQNVFAAGRVEAGEGALTSLLGLDERGDLLIGRSGSFTTDRASKYAR